MGAVADLLERANRGVKNAAEDLLMPLYERAEMPPAEKEKARASSDTFRKADDEFQAQKKSYRERKAKEGE